MIDNPGFGIDSCAIYNLDYTTGTGSMLGTGGTYGIHTLGGPLFDDSVSRLYVLSVDAEVYEADLMTLMLSPVLATGPTSPAAIRPATPASPARSPTARPASRRASSVQARSPGRYPMLWVAVAGTRGHGAMLHSS